jgi:hypothetical protein
MHLSGETNTGDIAGIDTGRSQDLLQSFLSSLPPGKRILLCPVRTRSIERILFYTASQEPSLFIDQHHLTPGRSHVDTQKIFHAHPSLRESKPAVLR